MSGAATREEHGGAARGASLAARVELFVVLGALAASAIAPYDRLTWVMEVAPVAIGLPIVLATARRFPLTPLVRRLLVVHAIILVVGGHWSYARVPLGEWARVAFDLARNPYDRLGHLAQGFVPALVARELLLRLDVVRRRGWLFFVVLSIALAISASYELVEWAAALLLRQGADEFLGLQGDPWDTQWDMFLAGVGATLAQLLLARLHDRALARIDPASCAGASSG